QAGARNALLIIFSVRNNCVCGNWSPYRSAALIIYLSLQKYRLVRVRIHIARAFRDRSERQYCLIIRCGMSLSTLTDQFFLGFFLNGNGVHDPVANEVTNDAKEHGRKPALVEPA